MKYLKIMTLLSGNLLIQSHKGYTPCLHQNKSCSSESNIVAVCSRLEQELMARIISEVYPLRDVPEPPGDVSHVLSEVSDDSQAEERDKAMFGKTLRVAVDDGCSMLQRNHVP